MRRLLSFLRPGVIVGPLPVTLVNGTVPDANQVMADFNWIVSQVNANASQGAGAITVNRLYNADMSLAQRIGVGGSLAIAGGTKAYTVDRWQVAAPASGAVTATQIVNPGLPQFNYALRVQRNSGNAATGSVAFAQSMESNDSYALQGQTVTLSFWARAGANFSPAGNTLTAQLWTGTGTDENILTSYTGGAASINGSFSLTNNWARYQASATLPSTMTEYAVSFGFAPTGSAGASDYADVTGVQVEIAAVASSFDFPRLADNIERCQRYYQKSFPLSVAPAQHVASGLVFCYANKAYPAQSSFTLPLLGPMRAAVAATLYNPTAANANVNNHTAGADYTACIGFASPACLVISGNPPSAGAVGDACEVCWSADAEL